MKKLLLVMPLLLISSFTSAQTDPCAVLNPPYTVLSSSFATITWLMDAMVPTSPTDPTLIPARINGFYIQIDTGVVLKVNPVPGAACAIGNVNAGKLPYTYKMTTFIPKGTHNLRVSGFNYVLDVNGLPTIVEQGGPIALIPFVANDVLTGSPPLLPANSIIRK